MKRFNRSCVFFRDLCWVRPAQVLSYILGFLKVNYYEEAHVYRNEYFKSWIIPAHNLAIERSLISLVFEFLVLIFFVMAYCVRFGFFRLEIGFIFGKKSGNHRYDDSTKQVQKFFKPH